MQRFAWRPAESARWLVCLKLWCAQLPVFCCNFFSSGKLFIQGIPKFDAHLLQQLGTKQRRRQLQQVPVAHLRQRGGLYFNPTKPRKPAVSEEARDPVLFQGKGRRTCESTQRSMRISTGTLQILFSTLFYRSFDRNRNCDRMMTCGCCRKA